MKMGITSMKNSQHMVTIAQSSTKIQIFEGKVKITSRLLDGILIEVCVKVS